MDEDSAGKRYPLHIPLHQNKLEFPVPPRYSQQYFFSQRAKASDDSLNDYLIDYCIQTGIISKEELAGFRPSIANRLDRNTSGIVLAGISIKGLQRLASMLRERTLGKYYLV